MMAFWIFVVLLAFVLWVVYDMQKKQKASAIQPVTAEAEIASQVTRPAPQGTFKVTIGDAEYDFSNSPLFREIEPVISSGDWDKARRYLQKVAYGMVSGTDSEKEAFKIFMMGFASADPLYAQCIHAIQPILQANPDGVRQTSLYPHMAAAPDTETARYVLYYAELMGAIRRKKKGNSYTVFPVTSKGIDIMETDSQRMASAPEKAFSWVFQEIALPSDQARSALLSAWLRVSNAGHDAGVRALGLVWPNEASWPSGEAYLRSKGWRPASDFGNDDEAADAYADEYDGPELMDLLFGRLMHVCHRLYRDPQVQRFIDPESPNRVKKYTGVIINRGGLLCKEEDPCEYGPDVVLSISEGLKLLSEPAHQHPACRCTVDPHPV